MNTWPRPALVHLAFEGFAIRFEALPHTPSYAAARNRTVRGGAL